MISREMECQVFRLQCFLTLYTNDQSISNEIEHFLYDLIIAAQKKSFPTVKKTTKYLSTYVSVPYKLGTNS